MNVWIKCCPKSNVDFANPQKLENLLSQIIEIYTQYGNLVFDDFLRLG